MGVKLSVVLVGVAIVALPLAGCGGSTAEGSPSARPTSGSSPSASASATVSDAALRRSITSLAQNYYGGRATVAFSYVSTYCRHIFLDAGGEKQEAADAARYGPQTPTKITIESDNAGQAVVSYTLTNPNLHYDHQLWIYENGLWRNNSC